MKFFHISDLHIGKRVNEYSMLDEQRYILNCIIDEASKEKPDAVLVAGDIYDKTTPSSEAVELFDDFLVRLSKLKTKIFIISGNHDSPERIAFAGRLLSKSNVFVSPVYDGSCSKISLSDEFGIVDVFLLPFIKPAMVKRFFEDKEIESYTDAVRTAISRIERDDNHRSVLVAHQFVTGATRSESEEISVGGSDNIDVQVFSGFDYVALGHIHGAQKICTENVRYSGTPLKYSFSEVKHVKAITVVELKEKTNVSISSIPLKPLHDLREVKNSFTEVIKLQHSEDYLHITLTDENDIPDALGRLREVFPNIMKLDYDNKRTREIRKIEAQRAEKSPLELFSELYEMQNNVKLSDEQLSLAGKIISEIWEESK